MRHSYKPTERPKNCPPSSAGHTSHGWPFVWLQKTIYSIKSEYINPNWKRNGTLQCFIRLAAGFFSPHTSATTPVPGIVEPPFDLAFDSCLGRSESFDPEDGFWYQQRQMQWNCSYSRPDYSEFTSLQFLIGTGPINVPCRSVCDNRRQQPQNTVFNGVAIHQLKSGNLDYSSLSQKWYLP